MTPVIPAVAPFYPVTVITLSKQALRETGQTTESNVVNLPHPCRVR